MLIIALRSFKDGDLVMVHLHRGRFPAGTYHKLHDKKKKNGLVPVIRRSRINDNAYIVQLPHTPPISPTFNICDLYEYFPPDNVHVLADDSGSNPLWEEGHDAVPAIFVLVLFCLSRFLSKLVSFVISISSCRFCFTESSFRCG